MFSKRWKKPVAVRVEQFKEFYSMKNQRPLLGFFYGSEYPLYRYSASRSLPEGSPLVIEDFPVESYLDDNERLFTRHDQCGGDFIWSAAPFWGIPWLEAALGCELIADQKTGSIHTNPPENFSGADSIPDFNLNNPWISKTVEFLHKMEKHSNGRYPLATTRMRGIADLLAALYGGTEIVFAMMDQPREIRKTAEKLTNFFIAYGRHQLEHIPDFYGGVGSFYYSMWAPKGTIWHQEDAAALLSPELYKKFIEPCVHRIVNSFSGCIIHQHPTGYYPVDSYLSMDMTALELHIDKGGPSAEQLFAVHKKILAKKPLLIWGDIPGNDLDWIFANLPPKGLAINTVVNSPEQAEMIWNRYKKS